MASSEYSQFVTTEIRQDGVAIICYNRPNNANAINPHIMRELVKAYKRALADDRVKVIVQTGKGNFFSAGMDLTNELPVDSDLDPLQLLHDIDRMLIDCDKITIAAVNGPGVGWGTTSLGLYDLVYAVDNAYFFTPFVKWGLAAEACSSFAFTHAMGRHKASHLLLAGERMTAQELESAGLISKIFPAEGFLEKVLTIATRVAGSPPIALRDNKRLITSFFKGELHRANDLEKDLFAKAAAGGETKRAVEKFAAEQKVKKQKSAAKAYL